MSSIGIIGAGKLSIVLAQLAIKAGYDVYISGSADPKKIALTVSVLVPGAIAMTSKELARKSDVVILAIPLGKYNELPKEELVGKLVVDAMNYWWEVDGLHSEFTESNTSTSEIVQEFLSGSRVVKTFSHIGYHDLHNEARPEGATDRKGMAIAGDNDTDLRTVSEIVNNLGFDPLVIGKLADGVALQPGGPVFGEHISASALRKLIMRK